MATTATAVLEESAALLTPEFARELAIVSTEMERPPYWFVGDEKRLQHATECVRQGHVTLNDEGAYDVQGSKKTIYTVREECPCPDGQRGKTKWCYHLIATVLFKEVCVRLGMQASLFPAPAMATNGLTVDSEGYIAEPPVPVEAVAPPPARDEAASARPPLWKAPALPMALGLRSITAIVADLSKPLPKACIATMPQGSSPVSYLHWQHVARVLDTYAPGWHGQVMGMEQVGKTWAITYRLTIPCREGEVSREATGQEDLDMRGYGDVTSNAEAMAFKRAAAKFGVGAWLYDKDDDPSGPALTAHLKKERMEALLELGTTLKAKGMERPAIVAWLQTVTGVHRVDQIPLAALRTMLAHVAQQEDVDVTI